MPELPEVETLTRAIRDTLLGCQVTDLRFFRTDLRDPIPIPELKKIFVGQRVMGVFRRSKYLLLQTPLGTGIIHLGMTGNLLRFDSDNLRFPHTHAIIVFEDQRGEKGFLHFIDPRRFGRFHCTESHDLSQHAFFESLGPEPLALSGKALGLHLYRRSRKRKAPIKSFIMDSRIVVGVGNIYASESLFRAGISPKRQAGAVSAAKYEGLATAIQETLNEAIGAGGTTLRDFKNSSGEPGYFSIKLNVYDRDGEACPRCQNEIRILRQGGRSTYYCNNCQK